MQQNIISEIKNKIGIITLKSDDGLNSINRSTLADIARFATEMDMNDSVKAIIIRGSDKAFSTGIDINEFASEINTVYLEKLYEDFDKISDLKKPVIAAVSGYTLGIGFDIALACDIILASESASFGYPNLSLGIIPGFGATQRLPNAIGKSKAMEMILTGRAMNAREAEKCGIISRIIPIRYLNEEALNTAEKIAAMPDLATNTSKELIKTAIGNTDLEEGLEIEKQVYKSSIESDEFRQNILNLAQK